MEFFTKLFDTSDFPARWSCGVWSDAHGTLHIASDVAVFLAYISIPCILIYLMRKRPDLPFPRVFWLFAAFILACGLTHLMEASLFWYPMYRVSGLLKALTAVVSWATVLTLAPTVKKALEMPGLAVVNARLEGEIEQRKRAEAELQAQAGRLQEHNSELVAFSRAVANREERMIELKGEVNELLAELERDPRYSSADYAT